MDEIIDLEEVTVEDETLKDFMKKDEEAEKKLNDKIEELAKEEEKLNKKEEELKSLEESNREKISTNASADELIEIAGKIKEVEEELSSIKQNIDSLSKEKEELVETKNNVESSKKEYIKSLNQTSSNYKEQLEKISEAIEVCDNPTLKQVLEDVQAKKNEELTELQEKRVSELRKVLNEEEPEDKPELELPKEETIQSSIENDKPVVPIIEIKEEQPILDIPVDPITYDVPNEVPIIDSDVNTDLNKPSDDVINLDAILNSVPDTNLNVINTDNIIIPEINQIDAQNENKIRIIYEKDVPEVALKEIYSSSKIMPSLNNYLETTNEGSFI